MTVAGVGQNLSQNKKPKVWYMSVGIYKFRGHRGLTGVWTCSVRRDSDDGYGEQGGPQ